MNKTPNQYDYVLQLFAQGDTFRDCFNYVHPDGNYAYSVCEGHSAIRIPLSNCGKVYAPVDKFPKAGNLFTDHKIDTENKIATLELMGLFATMQLQWKAKKQACQKCKGDGTVKCKCCENEADCKSCNGSGDSDIDIPFALIQPQGKNVKLFGRVYHPRYLNQVLLTALALGAQQITFTNATAPTKGTIVKVADAEVLLMPIMQNNNEDED